jgi:hypothetical protein
MLLRSSRGAIVIATALLLLVTIVFGMRMHRLEGDVAATRIALAASLSSWNEQRTGLRGLLYLPLCTPWLPMEAKCRVPVVVNARDRPQHLTATLDSVAAAAREFLISDDRCCIDESTITANLPVLEWRCHQYC